MNHKELDIRGVTDKQASEQQGTVEHYLEEFSIVELDERLEFVITEACNGACKSH